MASSKDCKDANMFLTLITRALDLPAETSTPGSQRGHHSAPRCGGQQLQVQINFDIPISLCVPHNRGQPGARLVDKERASGNICFWRELLLLWQQWL